MHFCPMFLHCISEKELNGYKKGCTCMRVKVDRVICDVFQTNRSNEDSLIEGVNAGLTD